MNVPGNTIDLVRAFEGFYAKPYLCPAGIATIGYGTIRYPNGIKVTLKDPMITKDRAVEYMMFELQRNVRETIRACPVLGTVDPKWFGAITDYVYNLGIGRLQTSTLRIKINQEMWDEVPFQLSRWVYGGGKKLKGLVLRRQAEGIYFN